MKNDLDVTYCTAFLGIRIVAAGTLQQVLASVKGTLDDSELMHLLIFDDATGRQIDVDFRELADGLGASPSDSMDTIPVKTSEAEPIRRAGRPKLGVVSGEVTLLPRHWEWLKSQPGGASVTLRKLIDEERRSGAKQDKALASKEATYHFMTAMAGNFPQYEEALRALYAGDSVRFFGCMEEWARDIRDHIQKLAAGAFAE